MALIKMVSVLIILATSSYAQSPLGSKAHAPVRPPLGLELPREEQGRPFYDSDYGYHKSQVNEESGAPIYNEKLPTDQDYWTILAQAQDNATPADTDSFYADLPSLPAQDLTPPLSVLQWNPDNDPTMYFQLPVEITKETVPTNIHPKKYHKVLVEKNKPVNGRPKEEISLIPISEDELIRAEMQLQKTAYNQAKVDHQRKLQREQDVQPQQGYDEQKVNQITKPNHKFNKEQEKSSKGKKYRAHYSKAKLTPPKDKDKFTIEVSLAPIANNTRSKTQDAEVSATGLWGAADHSSLEASHDGGLGTHSGERVDYQMRGHAGPHSYKFGFDTGKGKGHERQFRYEERDNHGYVKGHYGFYDKHGKLYMIKYDANPHDGFHADNGDSDGESF